MIVRKSEGLAEPRLRGIFLFFLGFGILECLTEIFPYFQENEQNMGYLGLISASMSFWYQDIEQNFTYPGNI